MTIIMMLGAVGPATVQAMPESIQIQGVLRGGDESPLVGTRQWQVQYFDAATGGNALGAVLAGQTVVSETGRWSISLTPPAPVLNAAGEVWYSIGIDSAIIPDGAVDPDDVFSSRVRVDSVMFAQQAREAQSLAGFETSELITETELQALLADRATTTALAAGLAGKADADHLHDDRYALLDHNHNGVYALVVHTHDFSELTGTATDAQIPNDITIDFAAAAGSASTADNATTATFAMHADTATTATFADSADLATTATLALNALASTTSGSADSATTAAVALALDGFNPVDYATAADLTTELAGKADSVHGHNFTELSGTATDAQIPDNITIDFATAAGSASTADNATTATFAVHADTATTATFAATTDNATTATVALNALASTTAGSADSATTAAVALALDGFNPADYATDTDLTAGLAGKADSVHGHNLQDLGGAVTDAQVPDDITITESDTLDSVTDRGSTTTNSIAVGALTADLLTLPQDLAPGVTSGTLYNVAGDLFWDGTQLNADADTLAGISGNNGDVLTYNSGHWAAAAPSGGGGASFRFARLLSNDSSVSSNERRFSSYAPSTSVGQGSDVHWDSLFGYFYIMTDGLYEVHFDGGVYSDGSSPDHYTEYEIRLYINGSQQIKTRINANIYWGIENSYSATLRWVGSVTAGDILEIRYANTSLHGFTPDPIGLQEGASVMVRKLD